MKILCGEEEVQDIFLLHCLDKLSVDLCFQGERRDHIGILNDTFHNFCTIFALLDL